MIKLVIFDMDGVLIDSEEAVTVAAVEALESWGIKASPSDFKQFTGMGENKFIGGVAELYGKEFDPAMKDLTYKIYVVKSVDTANNKIYVDTADERVTDYPWSKPIVSRLNQAGYKTAIASAADKIKVDCNVKCIGLDLSVFSAVITGSDVTRHKPNPDVFLKAAEKSGIAPQYSLVIEDAVSGVQAAKAAGMTCIALTTSFDEETLRNAGADYVLPGLENAFELISSL